MLQHSTVAPQFACKPQVQLSKANLNVKQALRKSTKWAQLPDYWPHETLNGLQRLSPAGYCLAQIHTGWKFSPDDDLLVGLSRISQCLPTLLVALLTHTNFAIVSDLCFLLTYIGFVFLFFFNISYLSSKLKNHWCEADTFWSSHLTLLKKQWPDIQKYRSQCCYKKTRETCSSCLETAGVCHWMWNMFIHHVVKLSQAKQFYEKCGWASCPQLV